MATAAELLDDPPLGEDDLDTPHEPELPGRYEVVDGRILEAPEMSDHAREVANVLHEAVAEYLRGNRIGRSRLELLYRIPQPGDQGRNRQPDWAFLSHARWPEGQPVPYRGNARDVVPDLAAEVVSPGDTADDLVAKVREYLRGGVRLVWVVYPLAQEVHAYLPGANTVRVYFAADDLDAGDLLPGFRTPVAALFPPTERPAPGAGPQPDPAA